MDSRTTNPQPRRGSFARPAKKKIVKCRMSLSDCSYSPSHFENVCNYFEEDLELKALKPRLLGSHTASELVEVLFEVWKCATEEQFTWFVGTFEKKMQLKNEQFLTQL